MRPPGLSQEAGGAAAQSPPPQARRVGCAVVRSMQSMQAPQKRARCCLLLHPPGPPACPPRWATGWGHAVAWLPPRCRPAPRAQSRAPAAAKQAVAVKCALALQQVFPFCPQVRHATRPSRASACSLGLAPALAVHAGPSFVHLRPPFTPRACRAPCCAPGPAPSRRRGCSPCTSAAEEPRVKRRRQGVPAERAAGGALGRASACPAKHRSRSCPAQGVAAASPLRGAQQR